MGEPAAGHAAHDPSMVAAAADRGGSLTLQLATCVDCAELHADLRALAAAVSSAAFPTRPRDFTLRQADADRLRPRGLRRLALAIGSPRDVVSRPLAIGLTTMGLAGLLVATVPGALSGGASSAAVLSTFAAPVGGGAAAAPSAAPSSEPMEIRVSPAPEVAAGGAGAQEPGDTTAGPAVDGTGRTPGVARPRGMVR